MIFTEKKIGTIAVKNRVVMPPMCMYSSDESGMVKPFHVVHYGTRAQGGVGLIILEATAVVPEGRISNADLGIWSDSHIEGLKSIVDIVHHFGAKIAIQLGHAGRKTGTGKGFSSSSIAFNEKYPEPLEMTRAQIEDVTQAFKKAAERAQKAGFDLIEIHGAHGYLINQFLSPLVNKRSDTYGCNPRYNLSFLTAIIKAIKEVYVGPVALRISGDEYEPQGLHAEDHVEIIKSLNADPQTQVNLLDVSSGGVTAAVPEIAFVAGYQVPFAAIIRKQVDIPVITGGLITTPTEIETILEKKEADFVWLGRELLRNPYWVLKTAEVLNVDCVLPRQYKRAEPYSS
ncbi:NADPH dehydrogenase NamA [Candidatus Lokiarchaeum ossiferum]|uniref:NADPH dehydrogenase NamA n=1 Tax=Candidatus Lokiarchaeum ossiferum TaxID=2951803 RepID=UPI00352F87D4